MRCDVTLVLEITPITPISHGAGNDGNVQRIAKLDHVMPDGTIESTPHVSGAALKAALREAAVLDFADELGIDDGGITMDRLRLLAKGGKNDSGGASVSIEEMRRIVDLAPMLDVFGAMDGGFPLHGRISVGAVLPVTDSTVESGIVRREIAVSAPTEGAPGLVRAATGDGYAIAPWLGREPVGDHVVVGHVQRYRHDLATSLLAPMIALEDRAAKDAAGDAIRESDRAPNKAERGAANESMPYAANVINPGVPMQATIRLQRVSAVALSAFLRALARWMASGGFLGGWRREGFGECRVRVIGIHTPWTGAGPTPMVGGMLDGTPAASRVFAEHVAARRTAILDYIGETKAAAAPKPAKGKKSKAEAGPVGGV